MEFQTSVVLSMPEKSRRTFDSLVRAWNRAHSSEKDYTPVATLSKGDKRKKISFEGPGLKAMKTEPSTRKALALFTRAYNKACLPKEPEPTPKAEEKPAPKKRTTRSRKKPAADS